MREGYVTEFDYKYEDVENCPYYGTENDMVATIPVCTRSKNGCRHYDGGYCIFSKTRDSQVEPCKYCGCTTIQFVKESAESNQLAVKCVNCGARTNWFDVNEHKDVKSLVVAVWNRGVVVNDK